MTTRFQIPPPEELPEGRYVLTEDVTNPNGDGRRSRQAWRYLKVIPKGSAFLVQRWKDGTLSLRGPGYGSMEAGPDTADGLAALILPKLAKAPDTLNTVLRLGGYRDSAHTVLDWFIRQGRLTLDDVRTAMAALDAAFDAEEERKGP